MLLVQLIRFTSMAVLVLLVLTAPWTEVSGREHKVSRQLLKTFPAPDADFQVHVTEVRSYLERTRLAGRSDADVAYNLPFARDADPDAPYRGRFLLIHGLNDSPYVWQDMATALAARGFDVRAILLPGHGNTPVAQLTVRWEQWLQAASEHLALWQTDDTPMYLGGFSLGAVIATLLTLDQADDIDGLLLVSPAWQSSRESLLRWAWLAKWFKPWVFGGMIIEDNPSRYNSLPINAMAQYYTGTRQLKRRWKQRRLAMPALVVASFDDSVVSIAAVRRIFERRFSSTDSRLLLYGNGEQDRYRSSHAEAISQTARAREVIRPSVAPEHRILNQAHMSPVNAPDNPLYGANGKQLVCNGNEWPVFSACLYYRGGDHWRAAEGTPSPDGTPVARTTFNPDFAGVLALFDQVFGIER